jgi:adenosylcobinamide amidohydrolase
MAARPFLTADRAPAVRGAERADTPALGALGAAEIEIPVAEGLPALVWRCGPGWRMASTTLIGGGLGPRRWVLNAQVPEGYGRTDPDAHLRELAAACGLRGQGVGMLTAAHVEALGRGDDQGVEVLVTTGLGSRGLAASSAQPQAPLPGTINLLAALPVALEDGALLNAIATATEAKTQALIQTGFPCTGTATDAVCIASLQSRSRAVFGGPRSHWGARLARAVHAAVLEGAARWLERNPSVVAELQPTDAFSPSAAAGTAPSAS